MTSHRQEYLLRSIVSDLYKTTAEIDMDWWKSLEPWKNTIIQHSCIHAANVLSMDMSANTKSRGLRIFKNRGPGVRAALDHIQDLPRLEQCIENSSYFEKFAYSLGYHIVVEQEYSIRKLEPNAPFRGCKQPPLIVLGLAGVGSTVLQTLLALDKNARALREYEILQPSSIFNTKEKKMEYCRDRFPLTGAKADQLAECSSIFDYTLSMVSIQPVDQGAPAYDDLMQWTQRPEVENRAYDFYRRFLQLLDAQDGNDDSECRRHWLLKDPIHLYHMNILLRIHPDARIVWIHRNVEDVLITKLGTDIFPPRESFFALVRSTNEGLKCRFEEVKDESRFCDVYFDDLQVDPVAVVKQIYSHFNMTVTDEHEAAIVDWWTKNKRAPTKYSISLESIGISNETILRGCHQYHKHFPRLAEKLQGKSDQET